jgi:hypothetical protein
MQVKRNEPVEVFRAVFFFGKVTCRDGVFAEPVVTVFCAGGVKKIMFNGRLILIVTEF